MKARYRLAPAAQQDIREHWHYIGIANHSPDAADRVVDLFFEKFELFATHPEIGELAHDFQDIRPGMRLFPAGSYVIYYRPIDNNQIVEVLHVLRGERDASVIIRGVGT